MVDPVQYVRDRVIERRILVSSVEHPSTPSKICTCDRCERLIYSHAVKPRFKGYSRIDPLAQESLTDDQYFICGREIEAFLFKQRSWRESSSRHSTVLMRLSLTMLRYHPQSTSTYRDSKRPRLIRTSSTVLY